jgi:predicted nuclease of restriction endonuclease-like RecB superfamily
MLRSEHSIVVYDRGRAIPDRLLRGTHKHYLSYAQRMLAAYKAGVGRTRRDLHNAVRAIFSAEPDCDPRRISSFCKLLDDAGTFDTDRRGAAAKLRLRVFAAAAEFHPLVTEPDSIFERGEREAKALVAAALDKRWTEIDAGLYVDVIDRQPLLSFDEPPTPEQLLTRYNLAQLQACLYKSQQMTVTATTDFAAIVRHAKLCRLLVETRRVADGKYRIDLSGPASVLLETRRYGINFARFVATLVSCRGWEMRATLVTRWQARVELRLGSEDGYRTHVASPAEFDSGIEAELAADWGESRGGWRLLRDAGILQFGQTTFVPDFRLVHDDGREALLEIVGFWTPEYLAAKRETVRKFRNHRILLAIPASTATDTAAASGAIVYKKKIDPDSVVQAAEARDQ